LWLVIGFVAVLGAAPLRAQYSPVPDAYSVTETNAMFGAPETLKIYRDGPKVVVDITPPASPGSPSTPARTVYDLRAGTSVSWDPTASDPQCGQGTFSGDWGDPFAGKINSDADMAKQNPKLVGTDAVAGLATKVYELTDPASGTAYKAWIDTKYGVPVKMELGGKIVAEITQIIVGAPPAGLFALPAACRNMAPMVTPEEKVAAETGGDAANYADASMAPEKASTSPCTVLFKVVKAGTMEPITVHYAVGLDLGQDPSPSYTTGVGLAGTATFSGGAIKDVSSQVHNAVLRIPNAPKTFHLDVEFGDAGAATALLYTQCFGPESTLFLIVKNPDKLSDGADWLWSKTGK
jgi:hypothetical protein